MKVAIQPGSIGSRLPEETTGQIELSIVLPCLNEEQTVGTCVAKARDFLLDHNIKGEVIVADNGSSDRSVEVAAANGATVVSVDERGYGNTLRGGFEAAGGQYIIMADADDSYDLSDLMPFMEKLREGYDLVMGNRFRGGIEKGAMPWHHRYVGNPVLSFIGRVFFHTPVRDFHCGIRGLSKAAIERMGLRTTGMELASEIVIKSSILKMRVCEVPVRLWPDGRDRPPHLRSFRDGWRHLRFLMLYSPRWLFLYPGLSLVIFGSLASVLLFFGSVTLPFRFFDFHSFIIAGTVLILGLNMLSFAVITRVYTFNAGLLPERPRIFDLFRYFNLETGLAAGCLFILTGTIIIGQAIALSYSPGFETIGFARSIRLVFGACLAIMAGGQVIFTSFVLSMLGINSK